DVVSGPPGRAEQPPPPPAPVLVLVLVLLLLVVVVLLPATAWTLKCWLSPLFEVHCSSAVPSAVPFAVTSSTLLLCRAVRRSTPVLTSVKDHCWFVCVPHVYWMTAAPSAIEAPLTSTHRLLLTFLSR